MSPPPDRQASQAELGSADSNLIDTNSQLGPGKKRIRPIKSEEDFYFNEGIKPMYDERDDKFNQSPNSSGQQWKQLQTTKVGFRKTPTDDKPFLVISRGYNKEEIPE